MKNLIYKEINLSVHKFFFILPLFLSLLLFIPSWIYVFVFLYFFWISVPQICAGYNSQNDYLFSLCLPVDKQSIVKSKIYVFIILELLHIGIAIIVTLIRNHLYGSYNFFFDLNYAFYGFTFLTFGLFNIVFLPKYFKTAYYFGKPLIIATIYVVLVSFLIEYLNIKFIGVNGVFESLNIFGVQLPILFAGVVSFIILNIIAYKKSISNYLETE